MSTDFMVLLTSAWGVRTSHLCTQPSIRVVAPTALITWEGLTQTAGTCRHEWPRSQHGHLPHAPLYIYKPSSVVMQTHVTNSMDQNPTWTVFELVKKFSASYWTRSFITAFTRTHNRSLYSARWIHSTLPNLSLKSILILSHIYI